MANRQTLLKTARHMCRLFGQGLEGPDSRDRQHFTAIGGDRPHIYVQFDRITWRRDTSQSIKSDNRTAAVYNDIKREQTETLNIDVSGVFVVRRQTVLCCCGRSLKLACLRYLQVQSPLDVLQLCLAKRLGSKPHHLSST